MDSGENDDTWWLLLLGFKTLFNISGHQRRFLHWARKVRQIVLGDSNFVLRFFYVPKNLRHGTNSFTVILRIFTLWKMHRPRPGYDTWWYRIPSFFITMQGVTPLLSRTSCVAGSGRFWNIHRTHPNESMRLRSLRQSERTTARDPVQHKRWTYPCYRAVNTEHKVRWMHWWCTTPSRHLAKRDK